MEIQRIQFSQTPTTTTPSNQNMHTAYVPNEEWIKALRSWAIIDCSIRTAEFVSLLAVKRLSDSELQNLDTSEIPRRHIKLKLGRTEGKRTAHADLIGYPDPVVGSATRPIAQDIIMSINGHAYANGSGQEGMEFPTRSNGNGITPTRLVTISGYAFATGLDRGVYKRTGINQWEAFDPTGLPPIPTEFNSSLESAELTYALGFNDLDGPHEQLLYAVGGKGDVWRYDGKRWHQCDFPSNEQLNTVTVAPDGTVYISGEGGSLWIGAGDAWKLAARGESSVLFNDSVWFNGQLWLCSDYQLKIWNGEALVRPRHDGQDIAYTGHMDARDGLLVIAGGAHVHCFDGEHWQCLVAPYR